MKQRAALAHLGNELVDNGLANLVNLKRPAGITIKVLNLLFQDQIWYRFATFIPRL